MALENHLMSLRDIKGYMASAVISNRGDMLAQDSIDSSFNLALVGATFTDIFNSAHEASSKIGLDSAREMTIETPKGNVLMFCSGPVCATNFRLIGVVSHDGNEALMDMQMKRLLEPIATELA
ncbi:MAG: hypothetical protein QMD53_05520 [Actinomycetota bacterium]|nr:hypothetical protein [Actinomycetota bacterium]